MSGLDVDDDVAFVIVMSGSQHRCGGIRRAMAGALSKFETLDKVVEAWRNRTTKPEIQVVAGQLPRVVNEAESAIISGGFDYYQRGSLIVRPTTVFVITAHGSSVAAQRLAPVNASNLAEAITRAASPPSPLLTQSGHQLASRSGGRSWFSPYQSIV